MNYLRIIFGLSLFITVNCAHALTIVHMQTRLGATTSEVYFELYDEVTPLNVSNFTGYITRGDYDNSFFHRKAQYADGSPFVVQGGGFTYNPKYDPYARVVSGNGIYCDGARLCDIADPVTGDVGLRPIGETYIIDANGDDIEDEDVDGIIYRVNDGLQRIPVDGTLLPVYSESGLSNLRGTIAMALSSTNGVTNPDSASNQWFINLSDNTQLDPNANNARFTVFGRVLGDGINFFDAVNNTNTLPIASNINPEFGELPVINYEAFTRVVDENLVKLNSASEVFNIDVTDYDFGYVVENGVPVQKVITLTVSPQWKAALDISKVGDAELLEAPFSATTTCNDPAIAVGSTCEITVTFAPTTADNFQDVLDIAFSSINIPNLPINLQATSRFLPRVASSTGSSLDFQFVYPGVSSTQTVSITNIGQQELTFDAIAIDDVSNFSQTNNCVALFYNESCEIEVTFNTPVEGLKTASLSIGTNAPAPESPFVIALLGTGSTTVIPDIDAKTSHDFGDLLNGETTSVEVTLTNRGTSDLNLISFTLTGDNASEFTRASSCALVLAPSASCVVTIEFSPTTLGAKKAELTIASDDPDESAFSINLTGTSSSESDNIPDAEENGAPNNGDGDSNGVPDRLQANVASMRIASGDYLTLVASGFISFKKTAIIANPSPANAPTGVQLDDGVLSFEFAPIPGTNQTKIGMILPVRPRVDSFYQYGPTPDDPVPHWYEFMFDQNTGTGAQILNNVTLTAPNGRAIQRDIVQIWYVDGQRGDADLTVNGNIINAGSVTMSKRDNSSASSSLSGYLVLMLIILLLTLRYGAHYTSCNRGRNCH